MENYKKNLKLLENNHIYSKDMEHDACGVGLVANIQGIKSHEIVKKSLTALRNLEHRGASGADPDTGDGAGILILVGGLIYVVKFYKLV